MANTRVRRVKPPLLPHPLPCPLYAFLTQIMDTMTDPASVSKDTGTPVEDVAASPPHTPHTSPDEAPEEPMSKLSRTETRALYIPRKIEKTRKAQRDKRELKAAGQSGLEGSSSVESAYRGAPSGGPINAGNAAGQGHQPAPHRAVNGPSRNQLQSQTRNALSRNRSHTYEPPPPLNTNRLIAFIDERILILTHRALAPVPHGLYRNTNFGQPMFEYMPQQWLQHPQFVCPVGNHHMVPGGVSFQIHRNGIGQYNGLGHAPFAPITAHAYTAGNANFDRGVLPFDYPYNPSPPAQHWPAVIPNYQYNQRMAYSQSSATQVGDSERPPLSTESMVAPKDVNLQLPTFVPYSEVDYKHVDPPTPTMVLEGFDIEKDLGPTVVGPAQSGASMPVHESSNGVPRLAVGVRDWDGTTKVQDDLTNSRTLIDKFVVPDGSISLVVRSNTSSATCLAPVSLPSTAYSNVQILTQSSAGTIGMKRRWWPSLKRICSRTVPSATLSVMLSRRRS
jgi:hypothetical protein